MFTNKSLRKKLYQNNLHPEKMSREISTQKNVKEHLQRISVQKPSLRKRNILHPKKSSWISLTKKKNLHKKSKNAQKNTSTETVYQKTLKSPCQKISEEKSLRKIFRKRHPHTKKIQYLKRNFYQRKKKKALQKKQIKNYLAKKLGRETFAFFQEKSLRNKMWRDIRTSKFVKRNLYQKMFEETFLPKSLKRHLQQRIWEGKSIAKNLSRTNPRNLWKEISTKTTLQRHLQNFSQEKFLPNKHLRGFFH